MKSYLDYNLMKSKVSSKVQIVHLFIHSFIAFNSYLAKNDPPLIFEPEHKYVDVNTT